MNLKTQILALMISMRPKHWSKNLLVFFALFFSANQFRDFGELDKAVSIFVDTTIVFMLFCALSSSVYILNDLMDINQDRQHWKKRNRPIVKGDLSRPLAWVFAVTLASAVVVVAFTWDQLFGRIAIAYLFSMIAYSLVIKHIVMLDLLLISFGFVLRAVGGAILLETPVSPWIYICTALGALFIVTSKRKSELKLAGNDPGRQRLTLNHYTDRTLDYLIAILASTTMLAYVMYTLTAPNIPENNTMMITIPFVGYGIFRYIYLTRNDELAESPEEILIADKPMIICVISWLITAATILIMWAE